LLSNSDLAAYVKDNIDIRVATEIYGLTYDRRGAALCPFHNEKTPSFRVKGDYYHCFGCGASGDVIKFVEELFDLDFIHSVKKLSGDFALNLPFECNVNEHQELSDKIEEIKYNRDLSLEKADAEDKLYWLLWDEYYRLDINKRNYAPKNPEEDLHPLFIEAINLMDYQRYLINDVLSGFDKAEDKVQFYIDYLIESDNGFKPRTGGEK
jgi:hypothetical protein